MSLAVFGSINVDLTTYGPRLPVPGETLHADRYAMGLGGKGCNQAAAVSKLGGDVAMVGRIGKDGFGQTALGALTALEIPCDDIHIDQNSDTGIAVISVDQNAENCITVIGGANMDIDGSDVERAKARFEAADLLLLQMEIPLEPALLAADIVRASGGLVILDPAPAPKDGYSRDVLERIDVLTPNETETEILTGMKPRNAQEAAIAAKLLRDKGVSVAVIKLGATGVYFQSDDEDGFVTPFDVDSIDSVAAGDCFNGGLAYAMADGQSLSDAVRFAAACGALSTTKRGASSSAPNLSDVQTLLAAQ